MYSLEYEAHVSTSHVCHIQAHNVISRGGNVETVASIYQYTILVPKYDINDDILIF